MRDRGEEIDILLAKRPDGTLDFLSPGQKSKADGSTLLSFGAVLAETADRGAGAQPTSPIIDDKPTPNEA